MSCRPLPVSSDHRSDPIELTAPATVIVNAWPKGWAAFQYAYLLGAGFAAGVSGIVFVGTVIARCMKWVFA